MSLPAAVPATMKALVLQEGHRVALVSDHPVAAIGDTDVLVKVVSVAQNPTDWKHVEYDRGVPGSVLGCDFSGIVVRTGDGVTASQSTGVRVGDHVAGFVHGGAWPDEGAFAEYVRAPADLVWRVPESTLGHDEAAALGCAFWTAAQALYHPTRLGLVEPPAKVPGDRDEWVLVYGGSSAVGQSAIQLLRLSGYKVVTTASPRNFALVTALGADAVFDWRDPDVVRKIKAATGDGVRRAFDAISEEGSQRVVAAAIRPEGGKVVLLIKQGAGVTERTDVEFKLTIVYTALGRAFQFGPEVRFAASDEDRAHMVQFLRKVPRLVREGLVRPPAVRLWEGGLPRVPEGLRYMREGRVSAEKIVYRV